MTAIKIPVTVLSGFIGAGKTTLLNHLLSNPQGLRIAAIVRDLSNLPELPDGCVACVLHGELLAEIERLARQRRFDAIVVELSGVAEPLPIAESFAMELEEGSRIADQVKLDTMVTVVDAADFMRDYASLESLEERGIATSDADDRTVVELLIEQIEFCDVLVINQIDLVEPVPLAELQAVLVQLNPRAVQIVARFGAVAANQLLNTGRFDFEAASGAPRWVAGLQEPVPTVADNAGIGRFVYRARRPFVPQRFWALLHQPWPGVLRTKGFFWLASRPDIAGNLSQAGGVCRHGPAGLWWVAQDRDEWPEDAESLAEIAGEWCSPEQGGDAVGDRRQELVMIGNDLDPAIWQAKFDACLLDDQEAAAAHADPVAWSDPFPAWEYEDHNALDDLHGPDEIHDHQHDHDHSHHHGHKH